MDDLSVDSRQSANLSSDLSAPPLRIPTAARLVGQVAYIRSWTRFRRSRARTAWHLEWQVRYRDQSGRRRAKDFLTKKQDESWEREQLRLVERGEWVNPNAAKVTVGSLWEAWKATKEVKPATMLAYNEVWRSLVEPRWGDVPLSQVTVTGVQAWLVGMKGATGKPRKAASASRKRQALVLLAGVLDMAVDDRRIMVNVARTATARRGSLPRKPAPSHRYLTHTEVEDVATAAGEHYKPFVLFLAYTGLRWGEATALRVADVNPLSGRINVSRSAARAPGGGVVYGTTKTHQVRSVGLPSFLKDDLTHLAAGKSPEDLLFTTPEGQPILNSGFRLWVWLPVLAKAKVEHLRIHDLRHTAASLAIAAGSDVKVLQSMLGHSSAAMTLDTYASVMPDRQHEVSTAMADGRARALADSAVHKDATKPDVAMLPVGVREA